MIRRIVTALSSTVYGVTIMPESNLTKTCKVCGETKDIRHFYLDGSCVKSFCKLCDNAKSKQWRLANPGKQKASLKRYYELNRESLIQKSIEYANAHPERTKATKRRSYELNRDAYRVSNKSWAEANKERMAQFRKNWRDANPGYSKQWAQRNKDKINSYSHNRRSRYVGTYTDADIKALWDKQHGRCAECKIKLLVRGKHPRPYHVDHIMPIALGGSNWPDNIQLLCPPCNIQKAAKDPYEWAKENGRLF